MPTRRFRLRHLARLAPFAVCGAATVLITLYSAVEQGTAHKSEVLAPLPRASRAASAVPSVEQLLSNGLSTPRTPEEIMQCVGYSGPCFFMNHPEGDTAPTHPVVAAKLEVPTRLQPTALPLRPVSLHDVRLLRWGGGRFVSAEQTNLRWLRRLDPDQMLYWFRNSSGLAQPRGVRSHGGWDGPGTGLRGHILGHYLSAASMAAAATGDGVLLRTLDNVTRGLEACQDALGDGYVSGFPDAEFRQMEDYPAPRYAWVPYYVMHKLLAGLVDYHRLWGSDRALRVAVRLAGHLWWRVERVLRRGAQRWYTFINQEVGGMSEVLTDLAVATANATWLVLAARFERPCFVAPLALAWEHQGASDNTGQKRANAAAAAIERMHGNTHLPQLLGAMARYEATGDGALRGAAEAFWAEIGNHQFVTGGSTVNEVWKGARTLGDVVSQHGATSFGAHDMHETCVSHNSMRVSRRLLSWGGPGGASHDGSHGGSTHTLAHAEYYEKTMLNAVLGTQRGVHPGQMLYMFPMGGGVAKSARRSGSELHHWGDHTTHWCCQGSGIEAFARLADSIFWTHNPSFGSVLMRSDYDGPRQQQSSADDAPSSPQLFVLQHISARLEWRAQRCVVELLADTPGSRAADAPLETTVRILRATATPEQPQPQGQRQRSPSSPEPFVVWLKWERLADSREHFQPLQAATWGPLVLAALTFGARTLPDDALLTPVPPEARCEARSSARCQLISLQHSAPPPVPPLTDAKAASTATQDANRTSPSSSSSVSGSEGCLVTRWERVWVVWQADRRRSFLASPSSACVARATPVGDEIAIWPQRDGGRGGRYTLDAKQSKGACSVYEGCLPGTGESPFASGTLHVMHNGVGKPIVLASKPPVVNGTRRGGTDAANAATWRLTATPVGLEKGSEVAAASSEGEMMYLESFDSPGYVLSVAAASTTVTLSRLVSIGPSAAAEKVAQRWRRERGVFHSVERPGMALVVAKGADAGASDEAPPPLLHLGAFASRAAVLRLGPAADASAFDTSGEPAARYPPLALWATPRPSAQAKWATPSSPGPGAGGAEAAERRHRDTYLMVPLNEVVDEHYSVYLCRLAARVTRPPPYCLD